MADDSCKFFDAMKAKYTLATTKKRIITASTMSKTEIMLAMIRIHDVS